jgi:hypothetical protein
MILEGELRRDLSATAPWQYSGSVTLPAGRTWGIRARVIEADGHKFFALEFQLVPGFSSAELEAVLVEMEAAEAEKARRDSLTMADVPNDELPF